jgi:hypothetical protein
MVKYNIVVCSYDKFLVNMAAYVIPGWICVFMCVCVCVCVCVCGALVSSKRKNNLALFSVKYELRHKKLFSIARILQWTRHVLCGVYCSVAVYKNSMLW